MPLTDEDDESQDPEDPDPSDMDDPDGPPMVACSYCGKMIHEDSEWCHHCGKFQSAEDEPRAVPKLVIIGTVLGIVSILGWILIWLVERIVNH